MIRRISMGSADILAFELGEDLKAREVERFHDEVRKAITEHGGVKLYLDVQNLESVTPRAVLEDLKLTPEYISDVERYAVVGDKRWQELVTRLGDIITVGEARYFEPDEATRAMRWLRREYTFDESTRRATATRRRGKRERRSGLFKSLVRAVGVGAAATWVMDRAAQYIMDRQDLMTVLREKLARIEGLDASHALANRLARRLGVDWRMGQPHTAGLAVHYSLGALTVAVYDVLQNRVQFAGRSRGVLLGLAAFVVIDEGFKPLAGASDPPISYPWQTHFRGLVAYLVFGITADTALRGLDRLDDSVERLRRGDDIDYGELIEEMERIRPYGGETDLERYPRPWQPASR